MSVSVLDLFKIGIGPSSSHTVGPMRAAYDFMQALEAKPDAAEVDRIVVDLFGSLSATGRGHGTDRAVIMGLMGNRPDAIDPEAIEPAVAALESTGILRAAGNRNINFDRQRDLRFSPLTLSHHPNALRFTATRHGQPVYRNTYYSVGGGFVVEESSIQDATAALDEHHAPHPFRSARELLDLCIEHNCAIADVVAANEASWRDAAQTRAAILAIWAAMRACVARGLTQQGVLPGGLNVTRRAYALHERLVGRPAEAGQLPNSPPRSVDPKTGDATAGDPTAGDAAPKSSESVPRTGPSSADLIARTFPAMDWVNLFALAVNEENAAGGRVVTAPTNGAAGIIPAVLHYYVRFQPASTDNDIVTFLLTATAIGCLFKRNASISGAEVGCQGEVGAACAMAAAGLAAIMGGTPAQVEHAAEIGLEHNLGLTCDPVGGLVQVPCIERNAIASMKAINAAHMAVCGDGLHRISLDQAIHTLRATGLDMLDKYKETSRGGLAVSYVEC
jgi:L-serine dehydratase